MGTNNMQLFSEFGIKVFGKVEWTFLKVAKVEDDPSFIEMISDAVVIMNKYSRLSVNFKFKQGGESPFSIEEGSTASLGDHVDPKLCILLQKQNQTTKATALKCFIADSKETLDTMYEYFKSVVVK